jgi:predicted transcriptional regulator
MAQSILEMTKDLTMALIQAGHLQPENVQETLAHIHADLMAIQVRETASPTVPVATPPTSIDWRKSITRQTVTCLVCGQTFKQLSLRHLRQHDLDRRSYRARFGIPRTQPLAAKATTARRRQVAQAIKPWEKTPRYLQAQEEKAAAAKKTGRQKRAPRAEA